MRLDDWVGIPYREGGRDRSGCDCWGIVRLYLMETHGLELPSFDGPTIPADHPYLTDIRAERLPWREIRDPEPRRVGDIGLWRRPGRELHAGVLVSASPALVLHNDSRCRGSAIQRMREVIGARPEWWRHAALEPPTLEPRR